MIITRPLGHKGNNLLHRGTIALSQVESNGIRIDMGYLRQTRKDIDIKVAKLQKELMADKIWKIWRRRFGDKAKLGSSQQLAVVLFKEMGIKSTGFTKSGNYSTDEQALEETNLEIAKTYLRWKKLQNANNTFLEGIERETCHGFLHPMYNLNLVVSYRSSSDNPNFQNYPVRDAEIGKLIRRCFIPRKGNVLIENDFKGIEVGVNACYCKDPRLIAYVKNPKLDMHRDMAMELFFLTLDEVDKLTRYCAKNGFVFPEFYGDWYKSVAAAMWQMFKRLNVRGPGGISMYKHLRSHGIKGLGLCEIDKDPVPHTFEYHVQEVERSFWKDRFKVYDKWKRDWFKEYQEKGYVDSYTGFRYEGVFDRKQICNWPPQGSAFHCLLWTLCETQDEQNRIKANRLTVGQIHDSMLTDCPVEEIDDHNELVHQKVSVELPRHWDWIIVPLTIETEITPPGMTWHDKKPVEVTHGKKRKIKFDDATFKQWNEAFEAMGKN